MDAKIQRKFTDMDQQIADIKMRLDNIEKTLSDMHAEKEKYRHDLNITLRALLEASMDTAKADLKQTIHQTVQSTITKLGMNSRMI